MTMLSNASSDAEALRVAIERQTLGLRVAVPCVVQAVDPSGRFVDVLPAVSLAQQLDGATKAVHLPVVRGVPVHVLGSTALGLFVAVPITPGDDGLLIVCDRALDNWQHGDGVQMPPLSASPRHHDLTDAVYIPGLQRMSGAIPAFPADELQIRNRAGTCMLAVGAGYVRVEVPGGAVLEAQGDTVTVTGKLVVSVSVTSPAVVAQTSLKVQGVEMDEHLHSDVTTGSDNSGPPVP